MVNFVSAVAYHSCLSLPAALTQPGQSLLADPCMGSEGDDGDDDEYQFLPSLFPIFASLTNMLGSPRTTRKAEKGDLRARHKFRCGESERKSAAPRSATSHPCIHLLLARPSLIYGVVRLVVRARRPYASPAAVRMISMLHILGRKPTDDKPENTPPFPSYELWP